MTKSSTRYLLVLGGFGLLLGLAIWRRRAARPTTAETDPGRRMPHVAGALDHPTGLVPLQAAGFVVRGWALSPQDPVCHIEVWMDRRFVGRAGLGRPRPDVAEETGKGAPLCGFELFVSIPITRRRPGRSASLQIAVTLLSGATDRWPPVPLKFEATASEGHPASGGPRVHRQRRAPTPTGAGAGAVRLLWFARGLDVGGSQLRMAEVIAHLDRVGGFTSTVLAPADGPLREVLEAAGATVDLTPLVPLDDFARYERSVTELTSRLESAFDLVIGPTVTSFPAVDAAIRLGVPSVLRLGEEVPLPNVVRWVQGELDPRIEARTFEVVEGASIVWSNSKAAVRTYRDNGYTGRFAVLGFGVDVASARTYFEAVTRQEAREHLRLKTDQRLVVCPSSVWPIKGQALLVEAIERLQDGRPDLQCVLLGQSEPVYVDAINQFVATSGLGRIVRVLPFCHDLRPWWRAADAAAFPSESESLPAAVLEAMAFELPVLATRVGDVADLVQPGRTGWLCDPCDFGDVVTGLDAIAEAPARALEAMGAEAQRKVARDHDRGTYLDRTVDLFRAALSGHLPPSVAS